MGDQGPRWVFREGDQALLVDRKGRRYLLTLNAMQTFHTHAGALPHVAIIGRESGGRLSAGSQRFLALKPTLADAIQEIPRATQVIYPKDIGPILVYGDVFPGARVLTAGLGAGALTLALLAAVGERGQVIAYEIREDVAEKGRRNLMRRNPVSQNLTIRMQDVYQAIEEQELDRIILDVPEPWQVVPHAAEALVPGGILLSYVPTVLQVHQMALALQEHPNFDMVETFETLLRPWHVTRRSVRPTHRMVAHTGFITTARKCSPGKFVLPDDMAER